MASIYGTMATQVPGNTQNALKGAQQAAKLQAQASVGGTAMGQPTMPGIPQVQQAAATVNQAQTKSGIQAVQQGAQEQVAAGQNMVNEKKIADANSVARRKQELQTKERELNATLNSLNSTLKGNLFDQQQNFAKDELGRTLFNDRQLLDWKIASAKSDNELRDYEQKVRQESAKKLQALQHAHNILKQQLEQAFKTGQQELDQAQTLRLTKAKIALEEKITKERNRSKNRASMFTAAGTVVGGVVGMYGGPAGAAAGASIGGGVGSMIGGATA